MPNVAVAVPPAQSVTVTIPIPETVKERYLEVPKVGTKEVVTAVVRLKQNQHYPDNWHTCKSLIT